MARNALGLEFGSAARLSKRPGSVWNCLWGHALKRSPGINRKRRVSYPGPGFLSSATWPSLPKKHYNGLNQIEWLLLKCASLIHESICVVMVLQSDLSATNPFVTILPADRVNPTSKQHYRIRVRG